MNIRISEGQLRFRITRVDLRALLGGAALELALPLAACPLHYGIMAADSAFPLTLEERSAGLALIVDRAALESFERRLPSREGMERRVTLGGAELLLVLEVDVRRARGGTGGE